MNNETESLNQKLYTDMEKGDSKAYAEDLKLIADNLKQYNTAMAELKKPSGNFGQSPGMIQSHKNIPRVIILRGDNPPEHLQE
nr:hypothetical protein [Methanobacterium formicicum]